MKPNNSGQHIFVCAFLIGIALPGVGCKQSSAAERSMESLTLSNGIRVVSIHFPGSTNVSIFSFLPMGLASDEAGQAQWSHLVEHLVIRSTMPTDSQQANAETLADHIRLDFYGNTANWMEGLSHHRRWLEGVPFTEETLAVEKPKVIAECDFTARNLATHKFAIAAWAQGFRHGAKHVALEGDVTKALLAGVQRSRDERLVVSNHVTVCVVGGVEAKTVFAEVENDFGSLHLQGRLPPASKIASANPDLTWDLDARHLLVTWPVPDFRQRERHAALMVAAQALNMQFFSDAELKRQTGMLLAGADLVTPEGSFFFVSASLRPGTDATAMRQTILKQLEKLAANLTSVPVAMIGRQLAANLTEIPDSQLLKGQTPPGMSLAMLEGNLGLQAGLNEHRYGDHRPALAQQLKEVSPSKAQKAVLEHLSADKAVVCTLRPSGP
jgi:predicted Zn-dependent peptidase